MDGDHVRAETIITMAVSVFVSICVSVAMAFRRERINSERRLQDARERAERRAEVERPWSG
jgi:sensor c-di-GMP phosphodiesterase-like protein